MGEEENLKEFINILAIQEAALDEIENGYNQCSKNYEEINKKIEMVKQQIQNSTLSKQLEMICENKINADGIKLTESTRKYSNDQIIELFQQINELTQKLNESHENGIQSLIEDLNNEENQPSHTKSEYSQEKEYASILKELGIDVDDF